MFNRLILALVAVVALALPAAARDNWELLGTQTVGFVNDRDVVRVGRQEGRFKAVQLRVRGNDIELLDLKVVYTNGAVDEYPVRQVIRANGQTGPIDLRGVARAIERVEMIYRSKPNFRGQAVVEVWGLHTTEPGFGPGAGGGGRPQPVFGFAGAPTGKWELLGTQRVGFGVDRDTIRVGRQEGGFRKVLLRVRDNDIELLNVRVFYGNGEPDDLAYRQIIRANGTSGPLDLRGYARAIDRIDLSYRSKPNFRGQAMVEVWGLHAEGAAGPGPGGRGGLVLLGEQTVGFGVDRDVIRVSQGEDYFRRERPFRNLHIAAERNDVHMMSIRIVYLNGFAENWSVDKLIRAGSEVVIDLRGERSYLKQIEMIYRSRPSFKGLAVVKVYGAVGGR